MGHWFPGAWCAGVTTALHSGEALKSTQKPHKANNRVYNRLGAKSEKTTHTCLSAEDLARAGHQDEGKGLAAWEALPRRGPGSRCRTQYTMGPHLCQDKEKEHLQRVAMRTDCPERGHSGCHPAPGSGAGAVRSSGAVIFFFYSRLFLKLLKLPPGAKTA